jgi:hypothetical protein
MPVFLSRRLFMNGRITAMKGQGQLPQASRPINPM